MAITSTEPTRRNWLRAAAGAVLAGALPVLARANGAAPDVEVWSRADCGCCTEWARHLQNHRFVVTQRHVQDVSAIRKQLGMPQKYAGCHVARAGGYVIDGHVPAADILRLLKERPRAIGLAVPDMPLGSPGMEQGARKDPYRVLLVGTDAQATVFASYP